MLWPKGSGLGIEISGPKATNSQDVAAGFLSHKLHSLYCCLPNSVIRISVGTCSAQYIREISMEIQPFWLSTFLVSFRRVLALLAELLKSLALLAALWKI
jgi:hypothetical protein